MRKKRNKRFLAIILACLMLFCVGCSEDILTGDDLDRAREAIAEKKWSLAERLLERYLREDGKNRWEAWLALLQCINSTGDHNRASVECLEVMLVEYDEDDEKLEYILAQLGKKYESMRRCDRAADAWSAYLDLGGLSSEQRVEAWRKLAAMQFAQRQFDAGEESLRQCLALPVSDHDKILCLLDLADQNMGLGNSQEVLDLSQQILDSEPDDRMRGLAGYLHADALEQLGQEKEALRQFERYRDFYPNVRVMDHRIELLRKNQGKKKTMIHHECGLFGIFDQPDAARLAYFGLYAQQHRGQESAGIVTIDGHGMHDHRGMGLVPDVFTEESLRRLTGNTAIGHVRYSTTGKSSARNAQPLIAHYRGRDIAVAHNGNIVNAAELRGQLEEDGAIFQTGNDSEVFMHLLVREMRKHDLPEAVERSCAKLKGAWCFIVLAEDTLLAVRDPNGFHPLVIGRLGDSTVLASETCAFDLLEAEYERSVEPGEMLIVDKNGRTCRKMNLPAPKRPSQCIFEMVYFARPDSCVFDEQVYVCRKQMGWQLAHESTPDVDFVMPFPDSGVYSAVGFAQCAELPYEHAMIRNHYVGRTFIQPTQSMRNFSVRVKINPVRPMIDGKRICIVDDSIVRGTTMMTRVKKLRELGAKEVHIRISSPPVKFPCHYGVDFSVRGELIAANYPEDEIARRLDVDSLHYLSMPGLLRSVMHSDSWCTACFDGNYPVPCGECAKMGLEEDNGKKA